MTTLTMKYAKTCHGTTTATRRQLHIGLDIMSPQFHVSISSRVIDDMWPHSRTSNVTAGYEIHGFTGCMMYRVVDQVICFMRQSQSYILMQYRLFVKSVKQSLSQPSRKNFWYKKAANCHHIWDLGTILMALVFFQFAEQRLV